ncbi:hypothetical protein C8T65DRAFT_136317 [Cerioporus squamosus]|nr:hypothetical protein C8T65DRAFT_136317 [Cerioporus squamosus]
MNIRPINIDDADSDDIQYLTADFWNHQVDKPNYQEGTFSEGVMNAQAEFRFNGTSVMVYGVASPRPPGKQSAIPPSVSFSIDGGIPTPVVSDPDLQDTEYSHQFFDSHTLSPGDHVLQMNVTQAEDDWPFVLDYILYQPLEPVSQPGANAAAPSARASAAQTSRTTAIAGGAAGAVVLLVAVMLYAIRRKALTDKHGPSINAVRKAESAKVDLLDDDCKFPPPSPVLTANSRSDVEFVFTHNRTELRYFSRPTSLSTEQQHLLAARGYRRSVSDVDSESAMSSQPARPPTPPASTFSHGSGASTHPSTTYQSVLTPPSAAYRTTSHGPQIFYRPATPSESSSQSSRAGWSSTGPDGSSMARQSEKAQLLREQRQATFHADSGVRFKAGQMLLAVDSQGPVNRRPPPPPPSETSTSTSASLMEWKWQQQGKERVSYGGSAISEVPPMYTPN